MKVEIWSDVMCPFCYIGKRRLELALDKFEHKNEVEITFRTFQLHPDAEKNTGLSMHEVLSKKMNGTVEQAKRMNNQVALQARELGLYYDFDNLIPTNTYDSLRLSYFAKEHGKMEEMFERMMKAYFVDSLDVGDHRVLAQLAKEVGLDEGEALKVLQSDQYSENLRQDKEDGVKLGIQGVPYFIVNDKYTISGAQPPETFLSVLNQAWKEEEEKRSVAPSANAYCEDGVCKK